MISKKASQIPDSITLAISAKVKELKSQGVDVIGFGAGEPDFKTPAVICKAGISAIEKGFTRYPPTPGIPELRKAISEWLGKTTGVDYSPSQILVSTGAKQSLYNIMQATIDEGDEVLLPVPYWLSYPEQVKMAGGRSIFIPTKEKNQYKLTPEDLQKVISPKSKLLVLNSPSNPSGVVYSKEEIEALIPLLLEHKILLISDEIYSQLIYDGISHISPVSLNSQIKEQTILVNGVSKSYAMTGWRIGFSAGPKEIIQGASRIQAHSTSGATSISQYAALAAFTEKEVEEEVKKMRDEFSKRRDYMYDRLSKMTGVEVIKPQGAFYLFPKISSFFGKSIGQKKIENSLDFAEALLEEEKVALVPGSAFGADENVRFSYATSMENMEKGMNRLESFLEKL